MATVSIKVGDTSRSLTSTLSLGGSAIDLTGATVKLLWRPLGNSTATEKSVSVTNAAAGQVEYIFTAADVAVPRIVYLVWKITFGDATILHVPSSGYHTLSIVPAI